MIRESLKKSVKYCYSVSESPTSFILIVGSGESGKSTIVKQMKIIHQNGYSTDELLNFRMIVHRNVVDSAQALIMAMRKLGVDPSEPSNRVSKTTND